MSPRFGVLSYLLRANVGYLDWELTADSCFWILVLERCESVAPGAGLVQDIKSGLRDLFMEDNTGGDRENNGSINIV